MRLNSLRLAATVSSSSDSSTWPCHAHPSVAVVRRLSLTFVCTDKGAAGRREATTRGALPRHAGGCSCILPTLATWFVRCVPVAKLQEPLEMQGEEAGD